MFSFSVTSNVFLNIGTDHGQNTKLVSGRWRRFWRGWVPISTGVGVSVLAVLQWRRLQREREYPPEGLIKEFEVTCYRSLPLRLWSRWWGWLTSVHVPSPLRPWVYGFYSSFYGVNLDEMSGNLADYPCLGQFFTRKLKDGTRPIDPIDCIVSPADGRVLNSGKIESCHVEQVKGVTYNLKTFLGPPTWKGSQHDDISAAKFIKEVSNTNKRTDENDNEVLKNKTNADNYLIPEVFWGGVDVVRYLFKAQQEQEDCVEENWDRYKSQLLTNPNNVLYQVVVYLAPGDYHRFHSPVQWTVNFRRHFQGELMSVNPLIAGWLPGLYSLNERVVYVGQWKHGFFSMTAVGATSVGSVRVYCDKTLHTNTKWWRDGTTHKDLVLNCSWEKGEEVGEFKMGSTLVLVFEAPRGYKFDLCPNQKLKVGQPLSGCKI